MNNDQQNTILTNQRPVDDFTGISVRGHIKIFDPQTKEIFVNKSNAIHYENLSEALASSIASTGSGFIYEMHFGNGGSTVDPTGVINYLPPNVKTQSSDLYNPTYYKCVDNNSVRNSDKSKNKIEIRHVPGTVYSDILVTCFLDYGEPVGQSTFDNSQNLSESYIFDELGLKSYTPAGDGLGKLLTHVIFHPVQKSLNRQIQVDYTVRIQTLTSLTS
jgi:hypothetical protein